MLILGIETATARVGCALGNQDGVLAAVHVGRHRRHVETLVPAIDFACHQGGVTLDDVACIAVDVGPGLFSGLRVGVATAKALAQALRIPTVGVRSLDLLAFPVRYTSRLIVAVIDARRGEVFCAFYRQVPGGVQRLSPHQLLSPADLASELLARGEECLLVGDGAVRYAEVLGETVSFELGGPLHACPSAEALVDLARPRALREEFSAFWDLEPFYLRRTDAEINWTTASDARAQPPAQGDPGHGSAADPVRDRRAG